MDDPSGIARLNFVEGGLPLQAVWNMGNMSYGRLEIFRNVSDSPTAAVRAGGMEGVSEDARGDALHYATCLEVRWAWIALPAALVLATAVLLSLTVAATTSQPLWKGSPLTLAFYWPKGAASCGKQPGRLETEETMDEMAKSITIPLEHSQDDVRLRTVKESS